jgi:Cupin superfamily protein
MCCNFLADGDRERPSQSAHVMAIQQAARSPLVQAAGNELRALLWPITPEAFVHEYWGKKSLFVKGWREKYAGFFDAESFSGALSGAGPFPPNFLRASFDKKTAAGTSAAPATADELSSTAFAANPDQAVPLFDAGATLCVSQLEVRVPGLVGFLAAIKRQLGYPGKVSFNGYLSPAQSGYNWHFDSRIATTLQIEGTKTWRYSSSPAIPWPRSNGSLRADGIARYSDPGVAAQNWERLAAFDAADTTEVTLEPGDLLVLPAGVWHEACGGTSGSLALNLTFTPISYTLLVRNLLDTLLAPEAGWRSPGPVLPGEAAGEVDPAGIAAISAQLARAASVLQSLSGDSAAVVRLWESFVQNPNPGQPMKPTPPGASTPVQPADRLRLRDDGRVYAMLAEGGSSLCVSIGTSREVELTGVAVGFVQRIIAEHEFTAADCVTWGTGGESFAWDDVQTILTDLKREGLIVSGPVAPGA